MLRTQNSFLNGIAQRSSHVFTLLILGCAKHPSVWPKLSSGLLFFGSVFLGVSFFLPLFWWFLLGKMLLRTKKKDQKQKQALP